MYMGRVNGINLYKHGIARSYLNLDDVGSCYVANGSGCYSHTDFDLEMKKLDATLEALHATLETPYDDAFITHKREKLRQHGIALLTLQVEAEDAMIH
jgi:hypothetical protein